MLILAALFFLSYFAVEEITNPIDNNYAYNLSNEILFAAAVFLVIYILTRYIDKRSLHDLGLVINRDWVIEFSGGMLTGTIILSAVFVIEYSAGWVEVKGFFYSRNEVNFPLELAGRVLGYFCVAFMEEIFSRAYQIKNIAEGFSGRMSSKAALIWAWLISSAIFGLLHGYNPNVTVISVINLVFIGLLFGYTFIIRGSLAFPIGLHLMWNFVEGNIFGYSVSGFFPEVSVVHIQQTGPELWTGGAFGPEAGALIIPALILGFFVALLWFKMRFGSAKWNLNLTMYYRNSF